MHIKSVEFAGAIGQAGQSPPSTVEGLPQVAFSGRSNVGKSSLINRLLGRTRTPIARVSQQPGKTREINFFVVRTGHGEFVAVDLPGYGYSRGPDADRERWRKIIGDFLAKSEELRGVVQLVDLRHGPTSDDLRSVDYLAELEIPALFVLTKADKLKTTKREEAAAKARRKLGVDADQTLLFSALKGWGREELLEVLASLLFPAPDAAGPDGADEEDGGGAAEPAESADGR